MNAAYHDGCRTGTGEDTYCIVTRGKGEKGNEK